MVMSASVFLFGGFVASEAFSEVFAKMVGLQVMFLITISAPSAAIACKAINN